MYLYSPARKTVGYPALAARPQAAGSGLQKVLVIVRECLPQVKRG
jgi:hypothetical protein